MKELFKRSKANHENKGKKGKAILSVLGGTTALAALAPAVGAAPIDFTGVDTGVSVGDAVTTGVNFMGIFGEWTTLAVGIAIAAPILGFVFWLVSKIPQKGKAKG